MFLLLHDEPQLDSYYDHTEPVGLYESLDLAILKIIEDIDICEYAFEANWRVYKTEGKFTLAATVYLVYSQHADDSSGYGKEIRTFVKKYYKDDTCKTLLFVKCHEQSEEKCPKSLS
jgi:hypothetical protein